MARKYPFTPVLGWSVSRYDKFTTCKRQYYYDYYAKYDVEVPQQRIAFLRSLTSVPLEVGNLVHDTISTLLNRLRRKFHDYQGIKFLATYHPAALLRYPQYKKDTWEDVQLLRSEYDKIKAGSL